MSNEVRQLLEDRLNAIWNSKTPITWDDSSRVPKVGESFIRCTLDEIDSSTISIKCTREFYLFTIQVFTPADSGSYDSMEFTNSLKLMFSRYESGNLLCTKALDQRVGSYKQFYQIRIVL